jgi:hypothetical protein
LAVRVLVPGVRETQPGVICYGVTCNLKCHILLLLLADILADMDSVLLSHPPTIYQTVRVLRTDTNLKPSPKSRFRSFCDAVYNLKCHIYCPMDSIA